MSDNVLRASRKRFGYGLAGTVAAGVAWLAFPGLPVIWAPRANAAAKTAGRMLFEHEWRPDDSLAGGDGLGPVFNARSCVACHFQGGVGGGGGNDRNVQAFEAMPTAADQGMRTGLVHHFAVENRYLEGNETLRKAFPILPGAVRVVGNCQVFVRDFDPVRTESVNSTALFGAGWIDRMSAKSITQQNLRKSLESMGRELTGDFKGVPAGRYRVLADGRVGKFGWKAQFATLEEFVAAACANEIGLGNPTMSQAKPMACGDYPDVPPDLDAPQFSDLVAFVDTLERPIEATSESKDGEARAAHGKEVFARVGCAICHTPDMGGVEGVYSDFLLHNIEPRLPGEGGGYGGGPALPDFPRPSEHPAPEEWKTPPLWGVADSAPYLHDGRASDLETAITQHQGAAETVTEAYEALGSEDRQALLAFLKTLKAPTNAKPADPAATVDFVVAHKPSARASRKK